MPEPEYMTTRKSWKKRIAPLASVVGSGASDARRRRSPGVDAEARARGAVDQRQHQHRRQLGDGERLESIGEREIGEEEREHARRRRACNRPAASDEPRDATVAAATVHAAHGGIAGR